MSWAQDERRNNPPQQRADESHQLFPTEDRYRLLVEAVTDYAVFMLDPQGIVSTWNTGAERIKGYSAETIVGRHFSIFYPPKAVAAGMPNHMLQIAVAEGRYVGEGWRVRKDGSRFWGGVVITPLRASDGTLIGFGKVTRDLTERRSAEESLRASHQRQTEIAAELAEVNAYLKNIFDASTLVAIIATDLNGLITLFNRGAERMLGYKADEIVGIHTPLLFHLEEEIEERRNSLSALLQRPVLGFGVFIGSIGNSDFDHSDWTYVRKDRTRITVALSLSEVCSEAGEAVGYLGVSEDITERRNATRTIASAYTQLNSVLECTSDCVLTIDRDWSLLYGNRRVLEILPEFRLGMSFWDCFPYLVGSPSEQLQRNAMVNRTEVSYECFSEPHRRWFRARLYPSEVGLNAFFTDITEEKKLREQVALEQVLREKRIEALSHMAGGLAHEISNPLAIIHARASDLMAQTETLSLLPSDLVAKASDSIIHTAERAIRILRGLRGFGREASKDPKEWASIDGIVNQCLELQQDRFLRHNIALRIDLPPDLPLVLCRETQIGQILTNLLNNAFDAVELSGGTDRWVELTATRQGETVVVHVIDSGPGVDDEFRPYLMEPFFTTKASGTGMGVGLSLSRAIAQDHGGSLTLRERNGATCFELILPVDPTVAPTEASLTIDQTADRPD